MPRYCPDFAQRDGVAARGEIGALQGDLVVDRQAAQVERFQVRQHPAHHVREDLHRDRPGPSSGNRNRVRLPAM